MGRPSPPHTRADGSGQHDHVRVHQGQAVGGPFDVREAVLRAVLPQLLPVLLPPRWRRRVYERVRHLRACDDSGETFFVVLSVYSPHMYHVGCSFGYVFVTSRVSFLTRALFVSQRRSY